MSLSIAVINQVLQTGFTGILGIVVTDVSDGKLVATAPINKNSLQPAGIVHGGVYLALAETLAGLGSASYVNINQYDVFGVQVSANHTGSAKSGEMNIVATCIHRGSKTHVWNVDVFDDQDNCLSTARVTNLIVKKA